MPGGTLCACPLQLRRWLRLEHEPPAPSQPPFPSVTTDTFASALIPLSIPHRNRWKVGKARMPLAAARPWLAAVCSQSTCKLFGLVGLSCDWLGGCGIVAVHLCRFGWWGGVGTGLSTAAVDRMDKLLSRNFRHCHTHRQPHLDHHQPPAVFSRQVSQDGGHHPAWAAPSSAVIHQNQLRWADRGRQRQGQVRCGTSEGQLPTLARSRQTDCDPNPCCNRHVPIIPGSLFRPPPNRRRLLQRAPTWFKRDAVDRIAFSSLLPCVSVCTLPFAKSPLLLIVGCCSACCRWVNRGLLLGCCHCRYYTAERCSCYSAAQLPAPTGTPQFLKPRRDSSALARATSCNGQGARWNRDWGEQAGIARHSEAASRGSRGAQDMVRTTSHSRQKEWQSSWSRQACPVQP